MPIGVSLFVWLREERAKWVEVRAKHEYWCAILGSNQRTFRPTQQQARTSADLRS
jgi:hypothetical protein